MPPGQQIRTMVVDDSEFFAEMTADTLSEDHGMDTIAVTNGEEALSILGSEQIDCIVSDYEMPGRNGLEFLDDVRNDYGDIPFILLTGRGDETIASRAIASGVADYLLKLKVVEDHQYGRLANRIQNVVSQQRTRRKHELFVENSPDAIAHVAYDGTLLAVNPAMRDMVSIERGQLQGKEIQSVMDDTGENRLGNGRESVDTGKIISNEDKYDNRHYHNRYVPMEGKPNENTFQMISRDITEQIERERELRKQNERLDAFASVLSHDLRNPLNVVMTSLQHIENEIDIDSEILERMDQSLTRMENLIEDVLTLSRQGSYAHEPEAVSLARMVDRAWANVETPQASLDVGELEKIEADPGRLQALLENLFANAITHAGSDVTVEVGPLDEGFFVTDDGPGIPEDERDAIFELGYTTADDGTGLGLSIVKEICSAHNWDIDLVEEGEGARFHVTGVTRPD